MSEPNKRRHFLKWMGAAAAAAPVVAFAGEGAVRDRIITPGTPLERDPGYELYAGFVLLKNDQAIPDFVQPAALEQSLGCGLGQSGARKAQTQTESFDSPEELAANLTFKLYGINDLPEGMRIGACSLRRHNSGRIMHANLAYQYWEAELGDWATLISVFAQTSYSRPYPLHAETPLEPDGPAVALRKTNQLPRPGVLVHNGFGESYHWIEDDVLYSLDCQHSDLVPDTRHLIQHLISY